MGTSTTRSGCSGHSGHHMRGSPLQRSPCDGLLRVLCILPCRNPPICNRYFIYSSSPTTKRRALVGQLVWKSSEGHPMRPNTLSYAASEHNNCERSEHH
jgi:hypothetical protein